MPIDLSAPPQPARRQERVEYRLMLALALPLCLAVAVVGRLVPRRAAAGRGSVFAEARETANTIVPMAFTA